MRTQKSALSEIWLQTNEAAKWGGLVLDERRLRLDRIFACRPMPQQRGQDPSHRKRKNEKPNGKMQAH